MTKQIIQYEFYAGPADGCTVDFEVGPPEVVYVKLPISHGGTTKAYRSPPSAPYAAYRLNRPTFGKFHWMFTKEA